MKTQVLGYGSGEFLVLDTSVSGKGQFPGVWFSPWRFYTLPRLGDVTKSRVGVRGVRRWSVKVWTGSSVDRFLKRVM